MITRGDMSRLKNNIELMYREKNQCLKRLDELKEFDGLRLKRSSPDRKHVYYSVKSKPSEPFVYTGGENHPTVKGIKEVYHIKELLRRLDTNIECMEAMATGYQSITAESIDSSLRITYRGGHKEDGAEAALKVKAWKERMQAIKDSYPVKNPEQLTQKYRDGIMMRSKAELSDAFCLDLHGIPFMYEVPIEIDGKIIYPDFRLLDPIDFETEYLLEQFGRMDLDDYQCSVGWKISKYMKKGFMPNVNFFMCFDDLEGNTDMGQLEEIVLKILGKSGNPSGQLLLAA